MKGHHDDLIMSLAMALYVAQNSFTQLKKNVAQAKAMIDAWVTDERKFNTTRGEPVFKPGKVSGRALPPSSNDPKDYLWMYTGLK